MLYPDAQGLYIQAGWTTDFNILPVKGKSQDLPVGFTGYSTAIATAEQYQRWARQKPEYNITLALVADSEFVLFDVDTDHEKGKEGYVQWFEFWDSLGIDCTEIDAQCWINSSRENPSARGQRLVRVPKGLEWPSKLDADIEIIRYGHRHAVVYPSIHPDTGRQYEWYKPGDTKTPSDRIPTPEDITFTLPEAAVRKITGGVKRQPRAQRKDMAWTEVSDWLISRADAEGTPCADMAAQLRKAKDLILNRHVYGLDVHHAMLRGTDSLIHLAHEGHSGGVTALQELFEVFTSVSETRDSDPALHAAEWKRAVEGSVAKKQGDPHKNCWCGMTLKKRNEGGTDLPQESAPAVQGSEEHAYERAVEAKKLQMRIDRDARHALAMEAQNAVAVESIADALAACLADEDDVAPTVGVLEDAFTGLFYKGQTNGIFGDGGTGKSLYQDSLRAKELNAGKYVVHWEFDNNTNRRLVRRLLNQGTAPEAIASRFIVLRSASEMNQLTPDVIKAVTLVTLDALTPSIIALGEDVNSPAGTDLAISTYLTPFTIHGACGIYIDHVGHENKDRQAGSIRKSQATQGALYEIKPQKVPSIGGTGLAELILRKDNQGGAGEVGKTAAWVTYESDRNGMLSVTASRSRNTDVTNRLVEDDWEVAKKNAESRKLFVEEKVVDVLRENRASTAAEIYQFLADAGYKGKISERAVKVAMDSLKFQGRIGKNELASGSKASGGRPTDRYSLINTRVPNE